MGGWWNKSALIGWKVSELWESVSQQSSNLSERNRQVFMMGGGREKGRHFVVGEALHDDDCGMRKTLDPELLPMDGPEQE